MSDEPPDKRWASDFDTAERDDRALDKAQDRQDRLDDFDELHGLHLVQPTFEQAVEQEARGKRASFEHSEEIKQRALRSVLGGRAPHVFAWHRDEEHDEPGLSVFVLTRHGVPIGVLSLLDEQVALPVVMVGRAVRAWNEGGA